MDIVIPRIKADPRIALLVFLTLVSLPLLYISLPIGLDWRDTYRPAALAILEGRSPYSVDIYYAAPWGAALLIPFAVLPYTIGRFLLFLFSLGSFALVGIKLGARPGSLVIFLTSAAVAGCLNNGNIEFLPLLGAIAPPWLGLILIAIKPQVGVGLAVYWAWSIWREKGFRAVLLTFLPVSLILSASFIIYGPWILRFSQTLAWSVDNTSLGLLGLALGLPVLLGAIRRRSPELALASSPLLSPYALQFTWVSLLASLLERPRALLLASIALWIPVILRVLES